MKLKHARRIPLERISETFQSSRAIDARIRKISNCEFRIIVCGFSFEGCSTEKKGGKLRGERESPAVPLFNKVGESQWK